MFYFEDLMEAFWGFTAGFPFCVSSPETKWLEDFIGKPVAPEPDFIDYLEDCAEHIGGTNGGTETQGLR